MLDPKIVGLATREVMAVVRVAQEAGTYHISSDVVGFPPQLQAHSGLGEQIQPITPGKLQGLCLAKT